MKNNDDRILRMQEQIMQKKEELKGEVKFNPITNCFLSLDGIDYNLHAVDKNTLQYIIIKLTSLEIGEVSVLNDVATSNLLDGFTMSGYKLSEWMDDCLAKLKVLQRKEELQKLKIMEDKLRKYLSQDKKVELELDSMEEFLK